eukprot:12407965-Karenia_brevis.AAC.1
MILEKLKVSSTDQNGGLTWLEIFILSVVASGHHMSITHSSSAIAHKPLHLHLKEFVSWAHSFVKFAILPHFADLFLAPTSTHNRLLHYGIISHFTHTRLFIQLPSCISSLLESVMLQLRSPFTRAQQQSYNNGTLQVPTHKYRGLGVVHSSSPLQRLSESLSESLAELEGSPGQPRPGGATVFSCPSGHTKLAQAPFDVMHPSKQ